MKSLVFDTGPVISLTTSNLLWILEPLKKRFRGEFYITDHVKKELVDKPLKTKKFKFKALQVLEYVKKGTLRSIESKGLSELAREILEVANSIFMTYGKPISIVHMAEVEVLALSIKQNAEALVVDERTLRTLIEQPDNLKDILENKLHCDIKLDIENLNRFKVLTEKIKILRSVELAAIAYEAGLLNKYILDIPNPRSTLLESILWGVKLNGCSVSAKEIRQIIGIERKS